jgi:hypothetical protein
MWLFKISVKGELDPLKKLTFEKNDVYLVDDKENNTIYVWVGNGVNQDKKDITAEIARKLDKERGGSTKILIMKQKREYGSFLAMMHDLEKGLIPGDTIERRPEFVFKVPAESIESVKLNGTPEVREDATEIRIRAWLAQLKEHRTSKVEQKPSKVTEAVKFIRIEKKNVIVEPHEDPQITVIEQAEEELGESDLKTQVKEAAYYLSQKGYTYSELCWILGEKIQKMSIEMPSIEEIRKKAEEVFRSSCTYDEVVWLISELETLAKRSYLEEKKRKSFSY